MDIFDVLEFWRVDALIDGAVCLKLAFLREASAECPYKEGDMEKVSFLQYSRVHLQLCEKVLVRGMRGVEQAHRLEYMEEGMQEEVRGGEEAIGAVEGTVGLRRKVACYGGMLCVFMVCVCCE